MNSFDKLKKWLGIKDTLKLFEREQRGIYSTIPIEKNKIIIKIKSKYLLEFQYIYSIYPIEDIEEANSLVAFYLTKLFYDKDEFWSEYIKSFPTDLTEFVVFWSEKNLNNIKQTSLYNWRDANYPLHMEKIQQDFDVINDYNHNNQIIQNVDDDEFYNNWLRFRILVGSRIFGYIKFGNETIGMVPYVDMINHSLMPNTTWYFDDGLDSFVLKSTKYINKGEEICDNYGVKNNVELLLYYGFTLDSNPNPILSFDIGKTNYFFGLDYPIANLSELDLNNKNLIKKKLEIIYSHHKKKILFTTNKDIINIFNDEIKIINFLLVNL
jgi:hypothetical protein